jgi:hypothetical protein
MVLQHWQIESNNLRKREITEAAKQLLADKEMVDFTEYIYRAVHESKWAIEDWEVRHGLIAESLIVYQRWLDSDTFRQYPQNVQDSFVLPDILILYYTTRPQPIKDRVSGVVSAGWLTGVADRRKTEYFGVYV